MAFMSKDVLKSEAERLGVSLEGLTYAQQQKQVIAAQTKDGSVMQARGGKKKALPPKPKRMSRDQFNTEIVNEFMRGDLDGEVAEEALKLHEDGPQFYTNPQTNLVESFKADKSVMYVTGEAHIAIEDIMDTLRGKKIVFAPEMAQTRFSLHKYYEKVGEEVKTQPAPTPKDWTNATEDVISLTVQKTESTGRIQEAETGYPYENAEISFRPDVDRFQVITFMNKSGYRYNQVRDLIQKTGYWPEYQKELCADHTFYLTGLLCAEIEYVHWIMMDIEEKEFAKRKVRGQL